MGSPPDALSLPRSLHLCLSSDRKLLKEGICCKEDMSCTFCKVWLDTVGCDANMNIARCYLQCSQPIPLKILSVRGAPITYSRSFVILYNVPPA